MLALHNFCYNDNFMLQLQNVIMTLDVKITELFLQCTDKQHIGLGANLHFLGDTEFGKRGLNRTRKVASDHGRVTKVIFNTYSVNETGKQIFLSAWTVSCLCCLKPRHQENIKT